MAAGRPTLTNCPGLVTDLVREAGAGVAVAPQEIGAGLHELAALDDERRAALGRAGQAWIAANQSRTAMAGRLARLLEGVSRAR